MFLKKENSGKKQFLLAKINGFNSTDTTLSQFSLFFSQNKKNKKIIPLHMKPLRQNLLRYTHDHNLIHIYIYIFFGEVPKNR